MTAALARFLAEREARRAAFLAAEWRPGRDGAGPENPLADRDCDLCLGHGVCDAGYETGCVLVNCPRCWA